MKLNKAIDANILLIFMALIVLSISSLNSVKYINFDQNLLDFDVLLNRIVKITAKIQSKQLLILLIKLLLLFVKGRYETRESRVSIPDIKNRDSRVLNLYTCNKAKLKFYF